MTAIATETFSGSSAANFSVTHGSWSETGGAYDSTTGGDFNRAIHTTALATANHEVQATLGGRSTNDHGYIGVRMHATLNTGYFLQWVENNNTDNVKLNQLDGGSQSDLTAATLAQSGAQLFRLVASTEGADARLIGYWWNGSAWVQQFTFLDTSSPFTNTRVGVMGWSNTGPRVDNFAAQDTAAATAKNHHRMLLGVG